MIFTYGTRKLEVVRRDDGGVFVETTRPSELGNSYPQSTYLVLDPTQRRQLAELLREEDR